MILVCGEGLIDLFFHPDDASGVSLKAQQGGSPFNLAVGIARLGEAVAFLGAFSTDHFGQLLIGAALSEGVEIAMAKRSLKPTALAVVTPDADGHPRYAFYAHQTAELDLTPQDLPAELPSTIQAITLGSYSIVSEPIGGSLLALAQREASKRVISLDPNLRPQLAGPADQWRAKFQAFSLTAAIIKLSDEDFVAGWGVDAEPDQVAQAWIASGVRLVVMTRGDRGAVAWWARGRVVVPGHPTEVLDAVGAGDSFHAALLARFAQTGRLNLAALAVLDRTSLEDAVGYANTAAALTCRRSGADMPQRAAVDRAYLGR